MRYFGLIAAFALGSLISVRSSEASGFSSPDSANHRPARVGVNKSLRRPTYFASTIVFIRLRFSTVSSGQPQISVFHDISCHVMSRHVRHVSLTRHVSYEYTLSFTENNAFTLVAFGVSFSGFGSRSLGLWIPSQ